jgi:hypothetical protein
MSPSWRFATSAKTITTDYVNGNSLRKIPG